MIFWTEVKEKLAETLHSLPLLSVVENRKKVRYKFKVEEEIRGMIFVLLATVAERFALLKLCNKYDRIFLHISEDNIRTVQTWIYM